MELTKGTIIRVIKTNENVKEANQEYEMVVSRVNKKTYTLEGITYNWGFKLKKEALERAHKDMWGTVTRYEIK
ncbi:hypothetical protein ACTNED_00765 [Absicoccus porci]|uniref:hypothetical protein n=1 Tax=Absicoccus porci TaxID=2486576 RepID=UPI003F8B92E7